MTPSSAANSGANPNELQQLRLAVDASGEIIFITDASGTFLYVNPQFVRTYGYEPSDVVGRVTPRILKSGTTSDEEYGAFWQQLLTNQVVTHEFVNRTKSGALLHIESSANPITDDRGRLAGFVAVQRDITERKRMEAELRESEQRYRTLAEAAQDSIFIVNRDRRIEYQNQALKERFGMTRTTIGKRVDEAFPPQIAAQMERHLSTVFETGAR